MIDESRDTKLYSHRDIRSRKSTVLFYKFVFAQSGLGISSGKEKTQSLKRLSGFIGWGST
jgi:hypothetical protein